MTKEYERITLIKIGGSSITNKAQEETLNVDAINWFSNLIARSVDEAFLSSSANVERPDFPKHLKLKPKNKFVIVHGAGSFGHHSAKRYGLQCGKKVYKDEVLSKKRKADDNEAIIVNQRYQMEGLAKTRQSVQKLNAAMVDALIQKGVNAVGISPGVSTPHLRAHGAVRSAYYRAKPTTDDTDKSPYAMLELCQSVKQCLDAGLVPVLHGDACLLYDDKRAGILSGDTLAEGLSVMWEKVSKKDFEHVVFLTDVAGVYTSDPRMNKDAKLIRCLKRDQDTGTIWPGYPTRYISFEQSCDLENEIEKFSKSNSAGLRPTVVRNIAAKLPTTFEELWYCDDSEKRKYGRSIINIVESFIKQNNLNEEKIASLKEYEKKGMDVDLNVTGSSHGHDVTGGLEAKLDSAMSIVETLKTVIITECCTKDGEIWTNGQFDSCWDIATGTHITCHLS